MTPIQRRAERVRGVALEAVLRLWDAQPDDHDHLKWHTRQGVLSITGSKFMNWSGQTGGGGAIDLVMHLDQRGFMPALLWLESHFDPAPSSADWARRLKLDRKTRFKNPRFRPEPGRSRA